MNFRPPSSPIVIPQTMRAMFKLKLSDLALNDLNKKKLIYPDILLEMTITAIGENEARSIAYNYENMCIDTSVYWKPDNFNDQKQWISCEEIFANESGIVMTRERYS